MTRKELDKFLKGASYEEITVMADRVAIDPALQFLEISLIAHRKFLTVFHLLTPFYISWLINGGFEVVKNLFRKWFGFQPITYKPFELKDFLLVAIISVFTYFLFSYIANRFSIAVPSSETRISRTRSAGRR